MWVGRAEVVDTERRPGRARSEDVKPLVSGLRGKAPHETGDIERGVITAGLVIGLVDDMPTCEALIARVVAERHAHLQQALAWTKA